jgi:hypothetical protein
VRRGRWLPPVLLGFEAFDGLAEYAIEGRGVLHHEEMADAGHQHDLHAVALE